MARKKAPWLKMRKKTDPEIPYEPQVWLGDLSNGEFFIPQTARDRKIRELIQRRCDDNARKLGMDRREFMASTMGMATALSVMNLASGCGTDGMRPSSAVNNFMAAQAGTPVTPTGGTPAGSAAGGRSDTPVPPSRGPAGSGGSMSSGGGGMGGGGPAPTPGGSGGSGGSGGAGFMVDQEICMDQAKAEALFGAEYFILDFQTHHTANGMSGPVLDGCTGGAMCTSPDTYVQKIFEQSDTTVAVLSGLPATIGPNGDLQGFSNEDMRASRDRVNKAAMSPPNGERMVAHCQIMPRMNPGANKEMMTMAKSLGTKGWKCYPPTEGGWFLHENDAFIQTAIELEEPLVCVHKGFPFPGWSRTHADPMPDVGVVAKKFPTVNFIIYHSATDSMHTEGPYNPMPNPADGGTDRLAKVVSENMLTNMNVYAEMGSAWLTHSRRSMDSAGHYIGKMLKYVGIDRLVWGSECVWFGSPQNQIMMFKAFNYDDAFADMHGYPHFTDELKRKIFGLTGAKLYRVDACATRIDVSRSMLAQNKRLLDEEFGKERFALQNRPVIASRRDYINLWKWRRAHGEEA